MATAYVMKLSCPERPGVAAAVFDFLRRRSCSILESQQFTDLSTARFFMRVVFGEPEGGLSLERAWSEFASLADGFTMEWSLRPKGLPRKVMILVSKFDHCLVDLLYRKRIGELPIEVTAVVTNHEAENYAHVDFDDAPLHVMPVTKATKAEQEEKLLDLIDETGTELVVLARYMQIFSQEMSARVSKRCINIHHSFLPGFKGAKPYHQAHARGVKLIGATAHYVTDDLDEGPIIEQDVERISHADSPEDLVRKGRDIERRVLARAVRYHLDDRVLLNGDKTVVFAD